MNKDVFLEFIVKQEPDEKNMQTHEIPLQKFGLTKFFQLRLVLKTLIIKMGEFVLDRLRDRSLRR